MNKKPLSGWAKPPAHEYHIPLVFEETPGKWLLYDNRVYRVGAMHPIDFERMVQSYASNTTQADNWLSGIDEWDMYARWYCCLELLRVGKIVLYDSREEAEAAREVAA